MRLQAEDGAMRPTLLRLIVIGAALAFAACSMLHRGKPDNSERRGRALRGSLIRGFRGGFAVG